MCPVRYIVNFGYEQMKKKRKKERKEKYHVKLSAARLPAAIGHGRGRRRGSQDPGIRPGGVSDGPGDLLNATLKGLAKAWNPQGSRKRKYTRKIP